MKSPNKDEISKLEELPNVGKAMKKYLHIIGVHHPRDLIGKDAFEMNELLCKRTNTTFDPCVIDVFMSIIHFMKTGEALLWWRFTQKRKSLYM